jgi:hypothetical protein
VENDKDGKKLGFRVVSSANAGVVNKLRAKWEPTEEVKREYRLS